MWMGKLGLFTVDTEFCAGWPLYLTWVMKFTSPMTEVALVFGLGASWPLAELRLTGEVGGRFTLVRLRVRAPMLIAVAVLEKVMRSTLSVEPVTLPALRLTVGA